MEMCSGLEKEGESESAACNYHDLCVNLLKGTMGLISLLLWLITHSKLTFIIFLLQLWPRGMITACFFSPPVLQMISPIPLPLKKLPWQAVNWILKANLFFINFPMKNTRLQFGNKIWNHGCLLYVGNKFKVSCPPKENLTIRIVHRS